MEVSCHLHAPATLPQGKKPLFTLDDCAPEFVWTRWPLSGIEPRSSSPSCSHCPDWAIPTPSYSYIYWVCSFVCSSIIKRFLCNINLKFRKQEQFSVCENETKSTSCSSVQFRSNFRALNKLTSSVSTPHIQQETLDPILFVLTFMSVVYSVYAELRALNATSYFVMLEP